MSNKHVVFAQDTKKKKVDKEEELMLEYDKAQIRSFMFAFNTTRKAYDIITTTIDLKTMESSSEVDKMRFDSEARAIMEVHKRIAEDVTRRNKRSR